MHQHDDFSNQMHRDSKVHVGTRPVLQTQTTVNYFCRMCIGMTHAGKGGNEDREAWIVAVPFCFFM